MSFPNFYRPRGIAADSSGAKAGTNACVGSDYARKGTALHGN
jgi:hypothetical protein